MESIRRDEVVLPAETTRQVSAEMMEVLMAMLKKESASRMTLPQLIEHPWLNQM